MRSCWWRISFEGQDHKNVIKLQQQEKRLVVGEKETFLHVKTQIYIQLLFVVAVERKISFKLDACDICVRCRYVGQKYGCRKNVDFFVCF